jgi:hypothetical protein
LLNEMPRTGASPEEIGRRAGPDTAPVTMDPVDGIVDAEDLVRHDPHRANCRLRRRHN